MIRTSDGREIYWANNIFFDLNIHELQVIQDDLSRLRILVVPARGYSDRDRDKIIEKVLQRVGHIEITVEAVDLIPRAANGKFQTVISKVQAAT